VDFKTLSKQLPFANFGGGVFIWDLDSEQQFCQCSNSHQSGFLILDFGWLFFNWGLPMVDSEIFA
jgi:hypothetical protein